MPKKLLRAFILSVSLTFIFLAGSICTEALVQGYEPIIEQTVSPENQADNPLGIAIIPSEKNNNLSNLEAMDEIGKGDYLDLGSEQVFPFEPGLGSNSGTATGMNR